MDKVLDKLDIYDATAVLLSGVYMISITGILFFDLSAFLDGSSSLPAFSTSNAWGGVGLVFLSYLVGLLFQEFGSFIQRNLLEMPKKCLKNLLTSNANGNVTTSLKLTTSHSTQLSSLEISLLEKSLPACMSPIKLENAESIYAFCRQFVRQAANTQKPDKDQMVAAQARSLSIYFLLASLACYPLQANYIPWSPFICGFLCIILWHRSIRFMKMRYTSILRSYCYHKTINELLKSATQPAEKAEEAAPTPTGKG